VLVARLAFATAFLAFAAGCAGSRVEPRAPMPGEAALRIDNDVGDAYEVGQLDLAIDGRPLPVTAIPAHKGDAPAVVVIKLPAGEHAFEAHAIVTENDTHDRVVVCTQQNVRAGATPGVVTVRIYSRPPAARDRALARGAGAVGPDDKDDRVALDIQLASAGAEAGPSVDACGTKAPVDRAICRAATQLDRAARSNDVVLTLCLRDRLTEMRRLADLKATSSADNGAAVDRKVVALEQQVNACVDASALGGGFDSTPPAKLPEPRSSALR
jgi:hypothetical protein